MSKTVTHLTYAFEWYVGWVVYSSTAEWHSYSKTLTVKNPRGKLLTSARFPMPPSFQEAEQVLNDYLASVERQEDNQSSSQEATSDPEGLQN